MKIRWRRLRTYFGCVFCGTSSFSYPAQATSSFEMLETSELTSAADEDFSANLGVSGCEVEAGNNKVVFGGVAGSVIETALSDDASTVLESLSDCKESRASCRNFRLSVLSFLCSKLRRVRLTKCVFHSRCLREVVQMQYRCRYRIVWLDL